MTTIRERIDALTHIEKNDETAPMPRGAKVGITDRCNHKCAFCAHSAMSVHGDMAWETYELVTRRLREAGLTHIGLFYLGESFLLDWLPQAVSHAVNLGFENVFLTTNGSIADPDSVRACMAAGLHSLKFSLNYSSAEQMAAITQTKPRLYMEVERNIIATRAVRDAGGYGCQLSASYINYDGEQGARMAERIAKLTPYLDAEPYALPLYNQAGLVENNGRGNPGRADNPVPLVPCWVLWGQAHITRDGKLSACCFDHAQSFVVGDLRTQTFEEAWNSEEFKALRRAHLSGDVSEIICGPCVGQARERERGRS